MPADPWDAAADRIGVPIPTLPPTHSERSPRTETRPDSPAAEVPPLRDGDDGLGRPTQAPADVRPLTDDDRRRLREAEEAQALRDLAEAEELLASDPALGWAGRLAHPLAAALLLGTTGVFGLFLTSQILSVVNGLAGQPEPVRYAGYAVLGVFGGAVLVSVLRLAWLYVRLRRNRQIRLDGLAELQTRTRLRWLAAAKSQEARGRLEEYLRAFPVRTENDRKALARLGVPVATAFELEAVRDELLDSARFASTVQWFERFRDGFQARLDDAAEARVSYWANRAMLTTAVAPNGLIDGLATAYFGFAMIDDLCRIYHLKAGRTGTAVLLGRVFFNAYLAGNLGDFEKLAEDQYDHLFEQGFQIVGVGMGGNLASKFVGKLGAKATTGYLNRVLLMRLGRYAARLLRPVSAD
ncbi:MAG: DUF697 domain-containing protein [Fimbriiglobus sp.]